MGVFRNFFTISKLTATYGRRRRSPERELSPFLCAELPSTSLFRRRHSRGQPAHAGRAAYVGRCVDVGCVTEVAEASGIAETTVSTHLSHLYERPPSRSSEACCRPLQSACRLSQQLPMCLPILLFGVQPHGQPELARNRDTFNSVPPLEAIQTNLASG
jgi:hypothetical protein